jgi:dolichol-phosphate mannosyltransferase
MGADVIVEMDADFSHDPKYIPQMLKEIKHWDVVIGSRAVPGGRDNRRGFLRSLITWLARRFIQFHLNLPIQDVSGGYRCFRGKVLKAIDLENVVSRGPSILQEISYKAFLKGFRFKEIPIIFTDRARGATKLNLKTLLESLMMVLVIKKRYSMKNI